MAYNSIKRQCERCGQDFLTNNAKIRDGNGRFCSRACYHAARKITYVDLTCAICNQPYQLELGQYNSRVKQGYPVKHCSVQCANQSSERSERMSISLKSSEKAKAAHKRAMIAAHAKMQSDQGRQAQRERIKLQLSDPEKRKRWHDGILQRSDNPLWRDAPTHQRGETNPNYKGNRRARNTAMGRKEYKDWRKTVFGRDKYTCQRCHKKGGYCIAHHIKPWADYPVLRYDVSNGETLCEQCHDLEHGKIRKPKS